MTGLEAALRRLLDALNRLGVPCMVGGSLASSIHGVPRATMDVDLVADLRPDQVAPLVSQLASDFYADAAMMRDAVRAGRAFNLIHYPSSYKFDVFPLSPDPYYQLQFQRRETTELPVPGEESLRFQVATAEDTMLAKLAWYDSGGRISERQWNDVLGIVRIRGDLLDVAYLRRWAAHLKVADLLERLGIAPEARPEAPR